MLYGHPGNEVDLLRPRRRAGRQGVLHNTELERVDVGEPLFKVVGVLFQDHVLTRDPLLEDIGAGALGMAQPVLAVGLKRRGGRHRDALEISAEGDEERPGGFFYAHTQCVRIDRFNLFDLLIVRSHPRFDFRIEDALDIPLGRRRIEVRPVVEFDALL